MNTGNRFILRASFFLFLLLPWAGCQKEMGRNEMARVNDVSISVQDFNRMADRQPLEAKMRLLTEQAQRDFFENYVITRELLLQEAKKKGIDKNPDMILKLEDVRRAMIIDALLDEVLRGKNEVSELEIRQYYRKNANRFTEPKEVKVRQIVVSSEAALKEVMKRLAAGERFETLASTYNPDSLRGEGGSLGYIRRGQLAPIFAPFEETAFSLKNKGDISEVVRTPHGYHLIQLEDKRGSTVRPLEQVKETIRAFLQAKKRQDAYLEYTRGLKSKAKISVNEKLWAKEFKVEEQTKGEAPKEDKK
jgi:peptidyl-prolyl cis-trans isomerase C